MTASMHCQCLRSSELPHTTRFYATFLDDFSRVAEFYAHPATLEGSLEAAREIELDPSVRQSVVDTLRDQNKRLGGGEATERNLERLARGACAVVTGQQVGLFTGPSYSFYKALTAIRLASELSAREVEAVPVFWLATEDHDLAEVNHCFWLTRRGIERFELPFSEKVAGRRVGEIALGEAIGSIAKAAAEALDGPAAEVIAKAIFDSYRPAETLGSSFGLVMARLFADRGIILLDPLDARLHRAAAGIYRQALRQSRVLADGLQARKKALEQMGYHPQVKTGERSTLLFLNVDGYGCRCGGGTTVLWPGRNISRWKNSSK
jgi:bacillithiol synthase